MARQFLKGNLLSIALWVHIIILPSVVAGQEVELEFRIDGPAGEKYYIEEYYGHEVNLIDSIVSNGSGRVVFNTTEDLPHGMYRLVKDRDTGLDFLFTGDKVEIAARNDLALDGVKILSDDQNRLFFQYLNTKNIFVGKLSALDQMLTRYPEEDDFYRTALTEFERLDAVYRQVLDSLLNAAPGSLVSTVIRWDQLPDLEPGALPVEAREILRGHYFDEVDMENEQVVRTPLLPIKVIDYLSLYIIPGTSRDRQESLFIRGVDSLMAFTLNSPAIKQAVIDYLMEGFERYGFEQVITHIGEKYVLGQSCVSEKEEEELRKRIEGFNKMAVGNTAPSFSFQRGEQLAIQSDSIEKPYRLLFFWASWCPHCTNMIPPLKEFYRTHADRVEIIAVSVDEHEEEWMKAGREHNMPWPSFAELEGWDGKTVEDYHVYATPVLFLLDDQMKIVAKPVSIRELHAFFEEKE